MTIGLDLVHGAIQGAKPSSDSEEVTSQATFDKIVSCIEKEQINEATALIEEILAKNIPDFRLIVYYFYARFFDEGIKSFGTIFPEMSAIIQDHWEIIRPLSRKEKQVQNSLNWLILQLISKLKYCEKQAKAGRSEGIWQKSTLEITHNEFNALVATLRGFAEFLTQKWPKFSTNERMMHLLQMVEELKVYLSEEHPEGAVEPQIVLEVPTVTPEAPISKEEPEPIIEIPIEINLNASPMDILSQKLKLFELFMHKKAFHKAALVAKDIEQLIENFDPLVYFPKLFGNYFALVAKNVAELSAEWERGETLEAKYLEKLYQTDLEKFIQW